MEGGYLPFAAFMVEDVAGCQLGNGQCAWACNKLSFAARHPNTDGQSWEVIAGQKPLGSQVPIGVEVTLFVTDPLLQQQVALAKRLLLFSFRFAAVIAVARFTEGFCRSTQLIVGYLIEFAPSVEGLIELLGRLLNDLFQPICVVPACLIEEVFIDLQDGLHLPKQQASHLRPEVNLRLNVLSKRQPTLLGINHLFDGIA